LTRDLENEAKRAENEAKRAENEAKRADNEAKKAESEAKRADNEKARADRLQAKLDQMENKGSALAFGNISSTQSMILGVSCTFLTSHLFSSLTLSFCWGPLASSHSEMSRKRTHRIDRP
jgi:small-conductance mechanosensitive channel